MNIALIAGVAGSVAAAFGIGMALTNQNAPRSTAQDPLIKVMADGSRIDTRTGLTVRETSPKREDKLVLTDEEWKKRLDPEQYRILRNHGTEPAFCGVNLESKGDGTYHCVGCDLPLFKGEDKFDSGTGWPSYTEPYNNENLWYRMDYSYGMRRVEVLCARCDGHLGHAFEDGPPPTGIRHCINGTVLKFVKKAKVE